MALKWPLARLPDQHQRSINHRLECIGDGHIGHPLVLGGPSAATRRSLDVAATHVAAICGCPRSGRGRLGSTLRFEEGPWQPPNEFSYNGSNGKPWQPPNLLRSCSRNPMFPPDTHLMRCGAKPPSSIDGFPGGKRPLGHPQNQVRRAISQFHTMGA